MHRIWDWIVGLIMIVLAIVAGGIDAGLVAIPATLGLSYLVDLEGQRGRTAFLCIAASVFLAFHGAGFCDFYRRRRANYVTGHAGVFHLIPRAIQRMRIGLELDGFIDESTNEPTAIQSPINAARRGMIALLITIATVAAVAFGAQSKGEWTLALMAVGFMGTLAGVCLSLQVVLAYAGFIRRQE